MYNKGHALFEGDWETSYSQQFGVYMLG